MLTSAEMSARRDKGLCYNCDEKYFPGHRCKNRILYMVMSEEEKSLYSQEIVELDMPDIKVVQMSLNSLMGEVSLTTMRVVGEVGNHQLNILLDSGSTLSFLQEDTTKKLGSTISPDIPLMVRVANGQKLLSTRRLLILNGQFRGIHFSSLLDY